LLFTDCHVRRHEVLGEVSNKLKEKQFRRKVILDGVLWVTCTFKAHPFN
jgi:hypothetical protein